MPKARSSWVWEAGSDSTAHGPSHAAHTGQQLSPAATLAGVCWVRQPRPLPLHPRTTHDTGTRPPADPYASPHSGRFRPRRPTEQCSWGEKDRADWSPVHKGSAKDTRPVPSSRCRAAALAERQDGRPGSTQRLLPWSPAPGRQPGPGSDLSQEGRPPSAKTPWDGTPEATLVPEME